MKRIFTLFLMVAVIGMVANAQKTLQAYATDLMPTCDGFIDDVEEPWRADWIDITEPIGDEAGNMSAQFMMLHGENHIHVAIKVQDDTPEAEQHANSWENDNVEWFFSMEDEPDASGAYEAGVWQLRMHRISYDDWSNEYFDGNGFGDQLPVLMESEDFFYGLEDDGSEYIQEMSLPISVMVNDADYNAEKFKFDVAVGNNVDGARAGQLFWNVNTDQQWQNTNDFGFVEVLSDKVTDAAELEVAAGKAFINGGMLNIRNVEGTVSVFNLKGALVRSIDVDGDAKVDVSDLNSGMYIVKGANLAAKVVK